MSEHFDKAWEEVLLLEEVKAEHRSGFTLGDYSEERILRYAMEELREQEDAPDDIGEMADVLCCLIAYCRRKQWNMHRVGLAMRQKLRARFPTAESILGPLTRSEE